MKKYLLIIILLFGTSFVFSQTNENKMKFDSINYEYSGIVYLDSVVVSASRKGFDVKDFITMVVNDNSFYKAFKNLHFAEYDFDSDITFYSKNEKEKAKLKSLNHQFYKDNCRWMIIKKEFENKNIFTKKKKYKYYTAKLYDRLFFTKSKICNEDTSKILDINQKTNSKMEEYILELKKLVFSPGHRADIPFIGKKMEIFSPDMRKYYNFSIEHKLFNDTVECYVFSAELKQNLSNSKKNNAIVKELKTYFKKNDLQIIYRDYHLKYKTFAYSFDVKMKIEVKKINEKYFPININYDGTWHILFKKRETCKFNTHIYNLTSI